MQAFFLKLKISTGDLCDTQNLRTLIGGMEYADRISDEANRQ